MGLKGIFSNSFETAEFGSNQNLMTHYYQANYEKVKNTIIDISKAIKNGTNKLRLVFNNTLRNMLGPYHRPRGEMGSLFSDYSDTEGPWVWSPKTEISWQENRSFDVPSWTDSYLCVPFGIAKAYVIKID